MSFNTLSLDDRFKKTIYLSRLIMPFLSCLKIFKLLVDVKNIEEKKGGTKKQTTLLSFLFCRNSFVFVFRYIHDQTFRVRILRNIDLDRLYLSLIVEVSTVCVLN